MMNDAFLDLVREDRRAATEQLVAMMGGRIQRLARHVLGQDADDGVQEAFHEIHRSLPRYRGEAAVTTWCYRIAMNTLLDLEKRRRRAAAVESLEQGEPRLAAETVSRFRDNPFTRLSRRELGDRVRQALAELDPNHRAVLVLRSFEDLSYREIAEVLGVPLGTVKSRMAAASIKLAEKLQAAMEEDMEEDSDGR